MKEADEWILHMDRQNFIGGYYSRYSRYCNSLKRTPKDKVNDILGDFATAENNACNSSNLPNQC